MSAMTAGAFVALEEIASRAIAVQIERHRSRWEVHVFRTMAALDHAHYEGESLLDAVRAAQAGEVGRSR